MVVSGFREGKGSPGFGGPRERSVNSVNQTKKQLTGTLGKVDNVIVKILKYISYVSAVCLVLIMLTAFFNVLGEKIFHKGIPSSTEIIQYLHVPMVFLASAYVTLDRGQTSIDLLYVHLPKVVKDVLLVIGNLIGAFICGFVAYRGMCLMINKHLKNHIMSSTTSSLAFPLWPFSLLFSLGFFLLAISFIWVIVRAFGPGEMVEVPDPNAAPEEEGGQEV